VRKGGAGRASEETVAEPKLRGERTRKDPRNSKRSSRKKEVSFPQGLPNV